GGRVLHEEDEISIDGTTGEVIAGGLATRPSQVLRTLVGRAQAAGVQEKQAPQGPEAAADPADAEAADAGASPAVATFRKVLAWADELRRMRVRANADTPTDARVARALGAEGIGLCRTEHMFFEEERIPWVRRMILADNDADRAEALAHLLPMQQKDFEGIFAALSGLPVTVRLLDPPLHEFLPHGDKALASLAKQMGVPAAKVAARAAALAEANPMLGHRGCRLGMTAPEIYEMQVEAITRAACVRTRAGDHVEAEIMVPLVGAEQEIVRLRQRITATIERVLADEELRLPIAIGTMIEVPRAALIADKIAAHADFFSFGTNDLTQMTYGYSRDDIGRFLPQYIESGVLPYDPFARFDDEGVGQLVWLACERGRQARADLHLGVCGEHGGDPDSIDFFERVGLDSVSCSPYRVPVARLAAARAAMARESATAAPSAPSAAAAAGAAATTRRAARKPAAKRPAEKRPAARRPAASRPEARRPAAGRAAAGRAAGNKRRDAAAGRSAGGRRPGVAGAARQGTKAAGRNAPRAAGGATRSRVAARKAASRPSAASPAKSRVAATRGRSARKSLSRAAGRTSRAAGTRAAKPAARRAARPAARRAAKPAPRAPKPAARRTAARATSRRTAKVAAGRAARATAGRTVKAAAGKAAKGGAGRRRRVASRRVPRR
ncbi:MAG: pyruvate, phosphate dikinase, partial [Acidobacteria bacterium]|nr:pyruvate, phosphate dikinase [Acidobacteriota bacterium]